VFKDARVSQVFEWFCCFGTNFCQKWWASFTPL